jgi:hypothetical protein
MPSRVATSASPTHKEASAHTFSMAYLVLSFQDSRRLT